MRTILWFVYFWVTLLLLVPAMQAAKRLTEQGQMEKRDALVERAVTRWMSSLLRLAGVTVHVEGRENIPDAPCVFVSNHQGYFDIPLLLCNLDKIHGIVAKIQLQRIPFIRTWMCFFGCVFIDRDNPRRSAQALAEAAENVRNGSSMIIFPEGTRSRGEEIGEFKAGGFRIAQKTKAPIVPICIDGSYKVMEANRMWIKPAHINLRILPPVETAELSKDEFKEIGARVRALIEAQKAVNHIANAADWLKKETGCMCTPFPF